MKSIDHIDHLTIILDPNYGERLRQIWPGRAVWIAMSPVNDLAVRALWASHPTADHLIGLTGFRFDVDLSPEDSLLQNLDAIDLHHGPYSTRSPYTALDVLGAQPSTDVRKALSELGFRDLTETADGFTCRRSIEEAKRLRN